MGKLLISAHILIMLEMLSSFKKWDTEMVINTADETHYSTQCQVAFLKYMENEYCAKHRHVPVNKIECAPRSNCIPSAMGTGSHESSFDSYDLSFNDEEYVMPNNVAETTPGCSERAACLLTVARCYLNSLPEAPKNREQINLNHNDHHSDQMGISSTFSIPDITEWWHQKEETYLKYTNICNSSRDIFSMVPHSVGVDIRFSLGRDVIGGRQSKTTGETLRVKVTVCQFGAANTGTLAGTYPEFDTTNTENDLEMNIEVEEWIWHRMANIRDYLEIWQGPQIQHATQKEYRAQNQQMTTVGYISDCEEIVKLSWSLFQHNGAAAFILSE